MSGHSFEHDLVVVAIIACILLAGTIMGWFLVLRPAINAMTKVVLFFGIAVLPITAALATNVVGFEETQTRAFCSSCHVMEPYTDDSANLASTTLASRHARNALFGDKNCYTCHSEGGAYGTVLTKLTGLKHVWIHYGVGARNWSYEEGFDRIRLYQPFANTGCTKCHSRTTPNYAEVRDHLGAKEALDAGEVSCASAGCHGPSHPFSKRRLEPTP
jgi:hypothetical protein